MADTFSELSISLTQKLTKKEKQQQGIFFTPKKIISKMLIRLLDFKDNIKTILEPSCGSCEFITELKHTFIDTQITGIEYNDIIYESIQHISNDNVKIINKDFLKFKSKDKFNLILGNPPFFVLPKKEVNPRYYTYFSGRPNIFILFIIKSIGLLKEGGILSFVLPKNFLNSLYYEKTRKFIHQNFTIIDIIDCEGEYIDTKQDTIIFILQKIKNLSGHYPFSININRHITFGTSQNIQNIQNSLTNCTFLNKLQLHCRVGKVVWNQVKHKLTDNHEKTRLIYSSDIIDNKLSIKTYKDVHKKNYIDCEGDNIVRLIINRGYGKGNYKFNYCIVNVDYNYVLENHVISVEGGDNELYEKVIKSFEDERTKQFIENYFGNNAISTTELSSILPIYI